MPKQDGREVPAETKADPELRHIPVVILSTSRQADQEVLKTWGVSGATKSMATILIVDDRPVNREFLVSLLGHGGHRLLEAADGAAALALLRAERPDLVITDILMPTTDGYEFAQAVRADPDPALAQTPIIFYTATYNAREGRALAEAAGVRYFLAKPAAPQLILQTVSLALGLAAPPALPPMATGPLQDLLQVVSGKLTQKMGELSGLERQLEALVQLLLQMTAERDPERLLQMACDAARAILGAQYAAIGMLADDRHTVRHFVTAGLDPETAARIGAPPTGRGVLGKLLSAGKPLRLADLSADPSSVGFPPGHPPMRSFLGVPLATPSGLYGRLYLTEKIGALEFSDEDERLATAVGAQVAITYENVLRYDEIQSHAARLQLEVGQRKQAEAQLAGSEERFRSFVENAMDVIIVVDEQGRIQYTSPSFERALGYPPAEVLGRNAFDFVHADDRARLLALFTRDIDQVGARTLAEFRLRDQQGDYREFEAVGTTVVDRSGQHTAIVYARDITERKRAEEARARLVDIIEATPDFVGWANPDGRVVYVNRAGREMVGIGGAEQIAGAQISDYAPAWANSLVLPEAIGTAIAKGAWSGESALLTRDGREIPVSQVVLAHYGPDGAVRYISTIARDISERKSAEEALRGYAGQQAAVAELGQLALTQSDLPALMDAAAALLVKALQVKFCEVMALSPDGQSLRMVAGAGWPDGTVGQATVGAGQASQAGYTLQSAGAVASDNLNEEQRFEVPAVLRDHGAASGMTAAIARPAGAFGVLGAFTTEPRKFGPDDVHFLEAMANGLGQAIARKEAEETLRQERTVLRTLIDNLPHAIYVKDLHSRFVVKNVADARRMGAASPDETIGKTDYDYYAPELAAQYYADDQAVITSGQPIIDREEPIRDASGRAGWTSTTKVPLRDPQGQVIGLVGIGQDITERRQRQLEVEAIATLSTALRAAATRAQMVPVVLDQVLKLFAASGAALHQYDAASQQAVIELARGPWAAWTGRRQPLDQGVTGQILTSGETYWTDDASQDPRLAAWGLDASVRAVAAVPIFAQGRAVAVLSVGRNTPFGPNDLRVLSAIADMAGNAMQRAMLHEQTERQVERLNALRSIDIAISTSLDPRVTLNIVLDQVVAQLQVDAADVYLLNASLLSVDFAAGRGFRTRRASAASIRLGHGFAGRVAMERRTLSLPDLNLATGMVRPGLFDAEGFRAYVGVPLIGKGEVLGVLEIFHRAPLQLDADWLYFLETLAGQTAIAINNGALFSGLQESNQSLNLAYDATIEGWSRALDLRDRETEGHSQRVTELTTRLAHAMGIGDAELVHIRRGALLHDIGKMGVPDNILLKPGPLTDDEWLVMRQHPTFAFNLLSPIQYLRPALDIPYCHHEKWDGTGYPRQLAGEAIPRSARIFAIVDVWDALRSDRPYRKSWSEAQGRAYIQNQSGKHFEPAVVDAFLQLLDERP